MYVIGAHSTQFKKWLELTNKQLAREALLGVLEDAGWRNGDQIENAYFSNCGMGVLWNQDLVRGHCVFAPLVEERALPGTDSYHQRGGGLCKRVACVSSGLEGHFERAS